MASAASATHSLCLRCPSSPAFWSASIFLRACPVARIAPPCLHDASALEEEGFELLVPPSKRKPVRRACLFVFWRPAAPAAIVLISENDDFVLPASQSNL